MRVSDFGVKTLVDHDVKIVSFEAICSLPAPSVIFRHPEPAEPCRANPLDGYTQPVDLSPGLNL